MIPICGMESVSKLFGSFLGKWGILKCDEAQPSHHRIVVVGGGSGGIAVAAQLKNTGKLDDKDKDIAIIEPSSKHYYQPLWTFVGGGIYNKQDSVGEEKDYIPKGTKWIQARVTNFDPQNKKVVLDNNKTVSYDYMVVAAGIEVDLDGVKGLRQAMGKDGVSTNYLYDYADKTWEFLKNFKGGTALFTFPQTGVKCGGAPQKIMWLAEDYLRRNGLRDKSNVVFALPGTTMFAVKKYSDALEELRVQRGVEAKWKHTLVEVIPDTKEAVFSTPDGPVKIKYDFLHVTPPMGPSTIIKNSPLAAANGYVDVDKNTLQHNKFKNVFALGDCANLPTSKTMAAITRQAPVVVSNLTHTIKGETLTAKYDGYTSCPLVVSYNKLILAEFIYDNIPYETFGWLHNQAKPSWISMEIKKSIFPKCYWHLFLKGLWYGPSTVFPPPEDQVAKAQQYLSKLPKTA